MLLGLGGSGCTPECRTKPGLASGSYASVGGIVQFGTTDYRAIAASKQMLVDHHAGTVSISRSADGRQIVERYRIVSYLGARPADAPARSTPDADTD